MLLRASFTRSVYLCMRIWGANFHKVDCFGNKLCKSTLLSVVLDMQMMLSQPSCRTLTGRTLRDQLQIPVQSSYMLWSDAACSDSRLSRQTCFR